MLQPDAAFRAFMGTLARRSVILALITNLAACGFHLRSYNFEGNVESFALTGNQRLAVATELKQALRQIGIAEVPADEAALVVELLDARNERRSVSTSGQARAAEYEIDYGVRYSILAQDGTVLAPPAWVQRVRVYRVDRDNIVGSNEEQRLLERELLRDVVGQIIRAMDAVSRNLGPADAA